MTKNVGRSKRLYSPDGISCTLSAVGGEKTGLYAIDMSYKSNAVTVNVAEAIGRKLKEIEDEKD